jgi:hypothetical protein
MRRMGTADMRRASRYVFAIVIAAAAMLSGCADDGALQVGAKAPSIKTKTLADVGGDFTRITTYRFPDERMYKYSLDQALVQGKPIVLEFATPGHCTVCDVQLQMLKDLVRRYQPRVIFLHMDQYQNPEAFRAFRVKGDPWTFIIDEHQIVRFKQAGRMLYGELDHAINSVLTAKTS